MFPSSHETWRNKQNTVALLVNFSHVTPTIVTAKQDVLSDADFLVDINMNVVIVRFYTYRLENKYGIFFQAVHLLTHKIKKLKMDIL